MKQSFYKLGALAAFALLTACGQQADKTQNNPQQASAASGSAAGAESAIETRQKLMHALKDDSGVMGKMIKGEVPFDAAAFQAAADRLAENSVKPWEHYTQESAAQSKEAKPEIWSKPDEFKKAVDQFTGAAAALKTAAASGKPDDVKKPFGEVGQSCKACHDSFRAD